MPQSKPFKCRPCNKRFKTKESLDQHQRDKHESKEGAKAVMSEMDDLPDGAFFAMAQDLGLEPEDFVSDS